MTEPRKPMPAMGKKEEVMAMHEIAEAVRRMDLEYDRVCRVYSDAVLLRAHVASMQAVIEELEGLEVRRDALAAEIASLERILIDLRPKVAQAQAVR